MDELKRYLINRIENNNLISMEDEVIVEYPFTIFINDEEFITLLCSPKSLKYLMVGFLHSEGLINSKNDIDKILIDTKKGIGYIYLNKYNNISKKLFGKRTITSGCGKGTIFYNVIDSFKTKKIDKKISLKSKDVSRLMKEFNKKSDLFLRTGGVHSTSLCSREEILIFEEDIGRHNALDKILGKALLEDIDLNDKIILTSGRITSEILIKIAKRKIPIIISRSAPTNLAIDIAKELNITIIGFVRGQKMNIYSDFPSLTT